MRRAHSLEVGGQIRFLHHSSDKSKHLLRDNSIFLKLQCLVQVLRPEKPQKEN